MLICFYLFLAALVVSVCFYLFLLYAFFLCVYLQNQESVDKAVSSGPGF